jgi:3-hydroxyisobutyrate dehydrogenase
MNRIGIVGLGHMGLPMAINLVKAGFIVTGFDMQATAMDQLVAAGGLAAANLQELAASKDTLITMLQTGQQVLSVCLGEQGLFQHAEKNCLFIDCSTIDVERSRQFHEHATSFGFLSVDAPVSGGVTGATQASLTFMVGGSDQAFEQAKPILTTMGKKIIHTGTEGSGQAAKICNNMILGVSMIAVSEAFLLAEQLGLTPKKLFEVVTNSSGQCWAMSHYPPVAGVLDNVPANHHYQPGFTSAMMLKDLCLSQDSASSVDIGTPMGKAAMMVYQQLVDHGMGDLDFSAIITDL